VPFSATLALLQKALPAPLGRKGRKEPSDMQQCETAPKCNRECVWFRRVFDYFDRVACLGRKEDAINEGEKAVELLPEFEDAVEGPKATAALAEIYASVGEHDEAFLLLDHLLAAPHGLTVPQLKLDPVWDPLRADPRFQKLCEEKQP
jgi:tetratricopeptide (TPR) repeat protein